MSVPSVSAYALYWRGRQQARAGQWGQAAETYEQALRRDDHVAAWHYRLGRARERTKQWRLAADAYAAAIRRDDRDATWHYRLGRAAEKAQQWARAAEAYEQAVRRDDRDAAWYHRLGRAHERAEQWRRAADAYAEAIRRDDRDLQWHYRLGHARERAKQWPEAVAAYRTALERDPSGTPRDRELLDGSVEVFWARRELRRFLAEHLDEIRSAAVQHPREIRETPKVYVYWGQGAVVAPAIVRRCIQELYAHHPAAQVVMLDDTLIPHYVDLPGPIRRLMATDKTKFSDVLRLALLARHGGVWVDATCLVTRNVVEEVSSRLHSGFFAFQYTTQGESRISSWFLASEPGNYIISMMLEANYAYWRHHEEASDYYLFHHIFEELCHLDEEFLACWERSGKKATKHAHMLQILMYDEYDANKLDKVLGGCFVHKLSRKLRWSRMTADSTLAHLVRHGPGREDDPLTLGLGRNG